VDITEVIDLKITAATKQVSQFEPSISKYRPDWDQKDLEKLIAGFKARAPKKDGRYIESFRRATGFNQQ
jgi:ribosomal protein L34